MENRQRDLARYRLDKAREDLDSARLNLENNKFAPSINRAYYAMFHAVRALFANEKFVSMSKLGSGGLKDKRVIVQGYGNVGYWAAKHLHA